MPSWNNHGAYEGPKNFQTIIAEQRHGVKWCKVCRGTGTVADYIGLEMKCVEVDCEVCHGTGKQ